MSMLGQMSVLFKEGDNPYTLFGHFGQCWAVWDDFNSDFGQMSVLFREGDNRFPID